MHLISPISIEGDLYCVNSGASNKRTQSVFPDTGANVAALVGAEADDLWDLKPNGASGGVGVLEFGVSCVSSITFRFTFDKDSQFDRADVEIYVNGVQKTGIGHDTPEYSNPNVIEPPLRDTEPIYPRLAAGSFTDYTLELTPSPCGNVIKLVGTMEYASSSGNIYITCAIIAMT